MTTGPWSVELYEDRRDHYPIEAWLRTLSDVKFAALQAAITYRLEAEGIALSGGAWLKPLGGGLHEFRVRHSADEIARMYTDQGEVAPRGRAHVLLRVFVHFHGSRMVLLLHGYDKGADPSPKRQNKEIQEARRRLTAWRGSGSTGPSDHPGR